MAFFVSSKIFIVGDENAMARIDPSLILSSSSSAIQLREDQYTLFDLAYDVHMTSSVLTTGFIDPVTGIAYLASNDDSLPEILLFDALALYPFGTVYPTVKHSKELSVYSISGVVYDPVGKIGYFYSSVPNEISRVLKVTNTDPLARSTFVLSIHMLVGTVQCGTVY